jgi:hypothetical protein
MEKNTVKLLDTNIIYVEKVGRQTARSMIKLFEEVSRLAVELRNAGRPVLILSNATQEGPMDKETQQASTGVGLHLIFDKSATYGSSAALHKTREKMISNSNLSGKVADFNTREEAEKWLLN